MALDATTGKLIWAIAAGGTVYAAPSVANGLVYVSSYGVEMALDTRTGKPLWSYATGGVIYVPTVVANGMVYVGSSNDTFSAFALQQGSGEKQART